jgi:hypothetical protein
MCHHMKLCFLCTPLAIAWVAVAARVGEDSQSHVAAAASTGASLSNGIGDEDIGSAQQTVATSSSETTRLLDEMAKQAVAVQADADSLTSPRSMPAPTAVLVSDDDDGDDDDDDDDEEEAQDQADDEASEKLEQEMCSGMTPPPPPPEVEAVTPSPKARRAVKAGNKAKQLAKEISLLELKVKHAKTMANSQKTHAKAAADQAMKLFEKAGAKAVKIARAKVAMATVAATAAAATAATAGTADAGKIAAAKKRACKARKARAKAEKDEARATSARKSADKQAEETSSKKIKADAEAQAAQAVASKLACESMALLKEMSEIGVVDH